MENPKFNIIAESFEDPEPEISDIPNIKCEYNNYEGEQIVAEYNYLDTPEASLEEENSQDESSNQAGESEVVQHTSSDLYTKALSGIFKCFRCDFSCTSTKDLITHYQRYREKEPFKCFECGYDGRDRLDFIEHHRSHFQNTYFKCTKCCFQAESSSSIKLHIQEKHSKPLKLEVYKCPICDRSLASKWNLKQHLGRCKGPLSNNSSRERNLNDLQELEDAEQHIKQEPNEDNPIFTCPYCFFIFSSKIKRKKHICSTHLKKKRIDDKDEEDKKVKVPLPIVNIDIDGNLKGATDMNPSVTLERIYLCPICHYVFTSASSLSKHILSHNKVTECPICKFECESNIILREHVATHSSAESRHLCTICDMKFPSLGKLKYHIKDEHSKKFKCSYCPRSIKTENAYNLHMEAHTKVMKDYYCPKCKFTARNSSLLQYHMSKFHPPEKRFVCQNCNKSYKYKYSLQRHHLNCPGKDIELALKGGKNYAPLSSAEIEIDISQKEKLSCSECKATFKEAEHLKRHLLVHFHMMPFRCLKCGFRCRTKHLLSAHMKIHNFKANYMCRVCGKKFKHRHALNNHFIIHSDARPYTCEVCSLTFKRKANYRRHYDIHSDVKPFKCPSCNFTARRKDGLQKHIVTHIKT